MPLRVLLVEDHPVNQLLITRLLERWGHKVSVADNGQKALDTLAGQVFDAVLMDMHMPVMDGLEATRCWREREQGRRTPVIGLTASAMEADREACMAAGMDDFLVKPINTEQLYERLPRVGARLQS